MIQVAQSGFIASEPNHLDSTEIPEKIPISEMVRSRVGGSNVHESIRPFLLEKKHMVYMILWGS